MRRSKADPPGLPRVYEGEAVFGELLARAGSTFDQAACRRLFAEATARGEAPPQVFPRLFAREPRFTSPGDARRLYGNLFGLWDLVAHGLEAPPHAPAVPRLRPRAERPEPVGDDAADDGFVEQAWRYLEDMPRREAARWRDRYEESQPQLAEFVREKAPAREVAAETADALCFELWSMHELAYGPARRRAAIDRLAALHGAAPGPISYGPHGDAAARPKEAALWRYAQEALTEAALDETAPIRADEREAIERLVQAVLAWFDEARGT